MNISSQSIFISKHQNTSMSHIMSKVNYFYSQRECATRKCSLKKKERKKVILKRRGRTYIFYFCIGSFRKGLFLKELILSYDCLPNHFSLNCNCVIMVYYSVSLNALLPDLAITHTDL